MNYYKIFGLAMIVITILIIAKVANAGEKSEWLNDNPCMIKVVITNTEECKDSMCLIKETVTKKEEVLECKDGYDGPNYWELFAQFYYVDVNTPEYCRYYSRSGHAFKTPGKVCLDTNGEWEVK